MKKYSPVVWLAVCGMLLSGCSKDNSDNIAYVEGQAVTLEEYAQYAYDSISIVSALYSRDYGADVNSDDFWETEYDGKTPLDTLKEQADERMQRQKGMQVLALEQGLITEKEMNWAGQQEAWTEENQTRAEKIKNNEVVYGPEQLSEAQFLSYWQSALEQKVEDYYYLQAQPSEKGLQEYYEQHYEELSSVNFTAEVDFYYCSQEEAVMDVKAELYQVLAQGLQGDAAAKELSERTGVTVSHHRDKVVTREMGKEDAVYTEVVNLLKEAETGDIAGNIFVQGQEIWIVPISRQNENIGTFEEARKEIEMLWRTEQAGQEIETRIDKMEVSTTELYDKLTIEQIRP